MFYPIGYGADPSGVQDSTEAIMAAVADAALTDNGQQLLPGVRDLGGATLDLQGGSFKISKPIVVPPNSGNLVVNFLNCPFLFYKSFDLDLISYLISLIWTFSYI